MTGSAYPIAYRARDVVYRLAPQDTYNYRKLREQKGARGRTSPNGWRMTGSAFPMHIGRGTLCTGWLRRIFTIIENCASNMGVRRRIGRKAGG